MKIIFPILILLLTVSEFSAQTKCGDLGSLPGKWVYTPAKGRDPLAVKNINTAAALLEKAVSGFAGGQAKSYTFTSAPVDIPGKRITGYTVALLFSQFECVGGVVKPEAATGTWMYIGFNEFPFFRSNNVVGILDNCAQSFYCLPNGQQMFFSKYKLDGTFNGLQRLAPIHHLAAEAVFLSKSGRLPFRSVTRAEVLVEYKKAFTARRDETIKRLEASIAKEPADLARMDADRAMAGREESKRALISSNNQARSTLTKLKNELAVCYKTIDSYTSTPAARMPAFVEVIDDYCDPERMFNPKNNISQIVVFDENYFDKTQSPSSPQFIVAYWRKGDAISLKTSKPDSGFRFPLKREFIRKFEQNFDFRTLESLLGR